MSRTAHVLVALAAAAVTATLGTTAGAAEVPSVKVKYADLDLQTPQGVSTLYRRLSVAAQEVCPQVQHSNLNDYVYTHKCQDAAIARAVSAINNPMLARLANDHGVSND